MRKPRLWFFCLVALLVTAPLQGGVSLAEENFIVQEITTATGINYLGVVQGISGFSVPSFSDRGKVSLSFNDVDISGIYNRNFGIGSFRNQSSVAFVNIEPSQDVLPMTFFGQMFSQGNKVTVGDYNYAINMNFSGFRASGIVVLDLMAGSFSNQTTSVTFNMGRNAIPPTPPASVLSVIQFPTTVVSLTNQQMQAIAATADNDFQMQGKQSAVATMQGTPNIQGIAAVTMSAGINNQVSHNVSVNFDTAK
jgi:hypothetical protein